MVKYLTEKGLFEDQMYQLLDILEKEGMVSSSSALDTIVRTFKKLEISPDYRITDSIYDTEKHKIVQGVVEPMNFALSHVAIMTEKNELYMFLDNNKLIFLYELTNKYNPMEVYMYIVSILGESDKYNFGFTPLLDPDTDAIEEIIGVKLIS